MKKVSIILPTFNGEKYIEESINSILHQTYKNWELIIVNDASNDNTQDIINKFAEQSFKITVIQNDKNLRLPASLNIGFKKATGEYFTWTSDDNIYKENAIEKMVKYLDENQEIDLVSFNTDIINEKGETERQLNEIYENRNTLQLTQGCNIGACFMYRKEIAQVVGLYDETMFYAEDYDFWCRIALKGKIAYSDENLYKYRIHPNSLSSTKVPQICEKIREIRHLYTQAIMTKLKLSKKEQVNRLLDFYYNETRDFEWYKMAKNTSKLHCYLYKIKKFFK